ncbi:MAG: amino acid adenylation domain-containing protein [Verrucomicrobiota bacterium]
MSDSAESNNILTRQPAEATSPVLSDAERHKLLVEWNRTGRDYPRDKCVHQLFEEQFARTPEAVAVVFEGISLTYRELNARSNQLAHYLRALGVGPDVLVALCVERSLEMIVAILGTLKAGGAYVPIDPGYPADRVAFMLEDANAPVVLTQEALQKKLPKVSAKIICLDSGWNVIEEESTTGPMSGVTAENLAYVIYTSGSTGRPKGVMVLHRGLTNYLTWCEKAYATSQGIGTPVHSSISFDLTITSLFLPLLAGKRLDMLREGEPGIEALCKALKDHSNYSFVKITPTHLALLAERISPVLAAKATHRLIIGGESLNGESLAFWQKHAPETILINEYGPTETVVGCCVYQLSKGERMAGSVPIGRPIANTQLYILDANLEPVSAGVPGELFIGGDGLARGYLNRPELTAEKFISNPFSADPLARLYRTGDLARWLPDGNIEFLGRMDQQVKIRGFRIEPGEIESVLCSHPALMSCAVLAQPDTTNRMSLTAFLVLRDIPALSVNTPRSWLAKKLPDYMIPSRFVAVPTLPLTPNGKLDRKALEKLNGKPLASDTEFTAPHNDLEKELTQIWQTVLRREQVGVHDNFFDLGGHSLLALVICSKIRLRFGIEVPLRRIFENPTIKKLADHMTVSEYHQQDNHSIEKMDRRQPLTVSFGQQAMWLLQQTLPDPATYNEPIAWRLSGRVDQGRIRRALQAILERHEVLRTALLLQGEDLVQKIFPALEIILPWREMDLQTTPAERLDAVLEERLLDEIRRPFDLAQAPLWRIVWIRLNAEEHVIAFTFHHSIVDEWSMQLFLREWQQLYAAAGQGEPAPLPELPVQYADYAVWQRKRFSPEFLEPQRAYWIRQLANLPPPLDLPADKIRPAQPSGRGAVYDFQITKPLATKLRALAKKENTTLFTLMLSTYQVWLHRYTGGTDLITGTPAAGRERPEVQSLMGYFLNTLPIRIRLDGGQNFLEVLGQLRRTLLEAFDHADLPFEHIVKWVIKERHLDSDPLFQTMFVLLEQELPALHLDQAKASRMPLENGASKKDLILNMQAAAETWDCRLEYATDLFTADCAASMVRHWEELLRSITENPLTPISQLQLMPEAEQRKILVEWNRTEREYPREKCIHHLFEEQVERTPDAVAVAFEDATLTYRQLNTKANQLAHQLQTLGVGQKSIVALYLDRSLEMIAGILGILKAGAAYAPIDPCHPADRVAFMLQDAETTVILTREAHREKLPETSAKIICLDSILETSHPEAEANPAIGTAADRVAYVMYTSGSTGQPKGVMVPHRAITRLVRNTNYIQLGQADVVAQASNTTFDAATFEIWGALLNGARLEIFPVELPTPQGFATLLRERQITTLFVTTALFNLLAREAPGIFKPLKQVLFGGEMADPGAVRAILQDSPPRRLLHVYGPTESTTFATWHLVEAVPDEALTVPIGRPIANTEGYILDANLQSVPIGVSGEIYIGGDGLALGYLKQPQLTAERFIPNPFSGKPGARLYRTGDQARWRADGNIEILGRLDTQVKIRGFRIELGEIESALRAQPEIREAVVVASNDLPDFKRLFAYLVPQTLDQPDIATLRQRLARNLPEYMLPSAVVWLDQLPLTPNGKVNRKALPAPETRDMAVADEISQPRNLLELELARIWQQLFLKENIGRQDNFFNLGGHSLLATRLMAELEKLLGRKIPIATLFQSPTIELLAERLTNEHWAPSWSSLVPLQTEGTKPPLFFMHGWGGDVYVHLKIAKLLPPDQPAYAIQAVGMDGKTARHNTVEGMAAHYVKEIVSFQPDGEVYLTGYSMGGLIAYEVAQQLHRQGRRVAMLALLDTAPITVPKAFYGLSMAMYFPGRCLFHLRRWLNMSRHDKLDYLNGRWAALRYWLTQNQRKATPPAIRPDPSVQAPKIAGFDDYYHAIAAAYRVKHYTGSVDIIICDQEDPAWKWWYWKYFVRGGTAYHRVPGAHLELIQSPKHMASMTQVLAAALEGAQQRERARRPHKSPPHANLVS